MIKSVNKWLIYRFSSLILTPIVFWLVVNMPKNIFVNQNTVVNFINDNLNKIKYDKYNKKIVDIQGMIYCNDNNKNILKIKIKDKPTNSNINKLRKSLFNSKKKN